MTALAIALAYLGTLAFAGFWVYLWMQPRHEVATLLERLAEAENALAARHTKSMTEIETAAKAGFELVKGQVDKLREDVSGLATMAHMRAPNPFAPPFLQGANGPLPSPASVLK